MKLLILAIFFIALSPAQDEQVYTISQEAIVSLDGKAVLPQRTTVPIVPVLSQNLRLQRYRVVSINHWWNYCHYKVLDWYYHLHSAIVKIEGIQHGLIAKSPLLTQLESKLLIPLWENCSFRNTVH